MKVAILSLAGKQGKTTLSVHLFAPRLKNAPIFAVETVNETAEAFGLPVRNYTRDNFPKLFKDLLMEDDVILDIGSSNVEGFLAGISRYEDSHVEIDYWIVPVTSGGIEQKETMKTVSMLSDFGIPREKILLVFNKVQADVEEEFAPLFNFSKKEKICVANKDAAIYQHELFQMLVSKKLSIDAIINDETDFKAKAREEKSNGGDAKLISHYLDMHTIKLGSKALHRNLESVYAALIH